VLLRLGNCQLDPHASDDLTDIVIAVDDSRGFAFVNDFGFIFQVQCAVSDP
jgi:hypothetical protein